jgi:tRNA pseudouridine55 synthase
MTSSDKRYVCVVDFRYGTDSHDREGRKTSPPAASFPSKEAVEKALDDLTGARPQVPPMFSAKKIRGEKCYRLARKGLDIPRDPVMIEIFRISLLAYEGHSATLLVHCSSGTYIRTLAHELGERLAAPAHLACLRRVSSGGFHIRDAAAMKALENAADAGSVWDHLIPPERMLLDFPWMVVSDEGERLFRHGGLLTGPVLLEAGGHAPEGSAKPVRVLNAGKFLLGLARPVSEDGSVYRPVVVLRPGT